jgi:hypothetical protein
MQKKITSCAVDDTVSRSERRHDDSGSGGGTTSRQRVGAVSQGLRREPGATTRAAVATSGERMEGEGKREKREEGRVCDLVPGQLGPFNWTRLRLVCPGYYNSLYLYTCTI